MNGNEFIKKLKKLGKKKGLTVSFVSKHGKGSHGRLFYGGKFTTIKDRTKEIKSGLLSAILKQLGINRQDIE